MDQPSLFDAGAGKRVVSFYPAFEDWLHAALKPLLSGIAPGDVWWRADRECQQLNAPPASQPAGRAYVRLGRLAACHVRADRWELCYRLLWRAHHGEHAVMQRSADPEVARLRDYAKAVSRERHKMRAFLRFRKVVDQADADGRYVAWFEPEHDVVGLNAAFFRERFSNMRWSILTPLVCAHWEGAGHVRFSPGVAKSWAPAADPLEAAWRTYYRSIFNPARVKLNAMRAEMPQKYWRNLPEARDVPALLGAAGPRVQRMREHPQQSAKLRCGPRPKSDG